MTNPAPPPGVTRRDCPFRALVCRHLLAGALLTLLVLLFALPHSLAQTAATGTITGRVESASSGASLSNARVSVKSANLTTLTNEIGEYRLSGVPAGSAILHVTYTGMTPQTLAVTVVSGVAAQQDVVLSLADANSLDGKTLVLEKYTVRDGELTGAAVAAQVKKEAANVIDVISLEALGDMGPTASAGEYLKYVPGYNMSFNPIEPAAGNMRGMPASGIIIAMDGAPLGSSAATAGRGTDLSSIATANIDRIEVTKTPTPDLPANAVGGMVNLIPKNPFRLKKAAFTYSLDLTTSSKAYFEDMITSFTTQANNKWLNHSYIQPGGSLTGSVPVNKDLAFSFTLSRQDFANDWDTYRTTWNRTSNVLSTVREEILGFGSEKRLGAISANWRLGKNHLLTASYQVSRATYTTISNGLELRPTGTVTGDGTYVQSSTGDVRQTTGWTRQYRSNDNARLKYEYNSEDWKIQAKASWAVGGFQQYPPGIGIFGGTSVTRTPTGLRLRLDGLDGMYANERPRITVTNSSGTAIKVLDNGVQPITQAFEIYTDVTKTALHADFSASRDFNWLVPVALKVGGAFDRTIWDQNNATIFYDFTPPGGNLVANTYGLVDDAYSNRITVLKDASGQRYDVRWVSMQKTYELYQANPTWFTQSAATQVTNWTNIASTSLRGTEDIPAAYVRLDGKFINDRLLVTGGVRWERTDQKGWGLKNDPTAYFQKDANGNLLTTSTGAYIPVTTNIVEQAKLQFTKRGAGKEKNYDGFYPSLNSSFKITSDLIVRAGWARTIGRPDVGDIVPGITITTPTGVESSRVITVRDGRLKPWTADNYDLTLESYGVKGATASVSLFRKDVINFFTTERQDATRELLEPLGLAGGDVFYSYDIITQKNSGAATVQGLELAYRQSFAVFKTLPTWLRAFEVFGNYTLVDVSGPEASNFVSVSPKVYNWGVSYSTRKFVAKWNVNDNGTFKKSLTDANGNYGFQNDGRRIDTSIEYNFWRNAKMYFTVRNLGNSPRIQGTKGPRIVDYTEVEQMNYTGVQILFGVKGSF